MDKGMIRITALPEAGSGVTLRVEGALRGSAVETLRRACRDAAAGGARIALDLAGVTFLDAAGVECVRGLSSGGVALLGCHGLVGELLRPAPAP